MANCPKCGGYLVGIGASDPESCAVLECDTCDYTRNLNDEFTITIRERSGFRGGDMDAEATGKTSGCESPQGPPVHDSACHGGNPAVNGVCDIPGCICLGEEVKQ